MVYCSEKQVANASFFKRLSPLVIININSFRFFVFVCFFVYVFEYARILAA